MRERTDGRPRRAVGSATGIVEKRNQRVKAKAPEPSGSGWVARALIGAGGLFRAIEHNHGLAVALLLSAVLIPGCQFLESRAESPTTGRPVTAGELAAEFHAAEDAALREADELHARALELIRQAEAIDTRRQRDAERYQAAAEEIRRKNEQRLALFHAVIDAASAAGLPMSGVAASPLLIAAGALWDNRRKDAVIRAKGGAA